MKTGMLLAVLAMTLPTYALTRRECRSLCRQFLAEQTIRTECADVRTLPNGHVRFRWKPSCRLHRLVAACHTGRVSCETTTTEPTSTTTTSTTVYRECQPPLYIGAACTTSSTITPQSPSGAFDD